MIKKQREVLFPRIKAQHQIQRTKLPPRFHLCWRQSASTFWFLSGSGLPSLSSPQARRIILSCLFFVKKLRQFFDVCMVHLHESVDTTPFESYNPFKDSNCSGIWKNLGHKGLREEYREDRRYILFSNLPGIHDKCKLINTALWPSDKITICQPSSVYAPQKLKQNKWRNM